MILKISVVGYISQVAELWHVAKLWRNWPGKLVAMEISGETGVKCIKSLGKLVYISGNRNSQFSSVWQVAKYWRYGPNKLILTQIPTKSGYKIHNSLKFRQKDTRKSHMKSTSIKISWQKQNRKKKSFKL